MEIEKFKNSKYIFIIGIGGSDLASKAVWNALTLHKTNENKKVFFLEAPDLREYEEIKNLVDNEIKDLSELAIIVASKSGETEETLTTFDKIYEILKNHPLGQKPTRMPLVGFVEERILIISSPQSSLWRKAEEKNIEKISWDKEVGGRFSAFATPHTDILSILGVNVFDFVESGKEAAKEYEKDLENNTAKDLARNIFENHKKGADILDFFIFNSELEDLGKWCRQLIAESLATFTPTVSLGPTDLHSMLELYLSGPKNRFTLFVFSEKEIDESVNESAYHNVIDAFTKNDLPFEKYEMPEINEKELGRFMALMIETTLYLAEFLGENPYDQPAVDEYKHQITNSK
jgi:glucose-6-phosphate isomerase